MDVLEIETREELEAWFRGQPPEVAQVVAARAALRALPFIIEAKGGDNFSSNILLPVFRAVVTSWVARRYPAHDVAEAAISAVSLVHASDHASAVLYAAEAAAHSAHFASTSSASAAVSYAYSASYSADAASWKESLQDCVFLEDAIQQGENAEQASRELAGHPLWRTQPMPSEAYENWLKFKDFLLSAGDNWIVWVNWCHMRLEGGNTLNAPYDLLQTLDVRIANLDEEFWKQGPAVVNAEIRLSLIHI